jgi:hypothetical protein
MKPIYSKFMVYIGVTFLEDNSSKLTKILSFLLLLLSLSLSLSLSRVSWLKGGQIGV